MTSPRRSSEAGPSRLETASVERELPVSTASQKRRHVEGDPPPKNLQACDRCRTKKTKCEPRDSRDQCKACHASSLICTFDLPLTASRTKRVRRGLNLVNGMGGGPSRPGGTERDDRSESGRSPTPTPTPATTRPRFRLKPARSSSSRREGPTSLVYILHAAPTLPLFVLDQYNANHNLALQRHPSNSGDGYIEVTHTRPTAIDPDPATPVLEAMLPESWNEIVNKLVETFHERITPLIPIVTPEQACGELLKYALAAVMAARNNIPREIFDALQYIVNTEIIEQDTLSDTSQESIQILLVSCLVDELAPTTGLASAQSHARTRLSAAILMAQDLCYDHPGAAADNARLWQCALVLDTWDAARHGVKPILTPSDFTKISQKDPSDNFFEHLFSLSGLLARLLHAIYGPTGISKATNSLLNPLRTDIRAWRDHLPDALRLTGFSSPLPAGILHLLHTAVLILLFRPFMRWSFIVSPSLTHNLDMPAWAEIHVASRAALGWAAMQDDVIDLLFFGPYALGLSAFMQYHSWARRREWNGVVTLEKICREGVEKWIARWPPGYLPIQRAQLELITLLHQATESLAGTNVTSFDSPRGLNPTPGSLNRIPEMPINGITFLRDPSHPKGGVLVATQQAAREIKDLPAGTVIIGGPPLDDTALNTNPSHTGPNPLESLAALAGGENMGGFAMGLGGMDSGNATAGFMVGNGGAGNEMMASNASPMDWDAFIAAYGFGDGMPVIPP